MEVIGYILIGVGAFSLFGNLTGAGGADDPSPTSVNKRAGCWLVLIVVGCLVAWLAR